MTLSIMPSLSQAPEKPKLSQSLPVSAPVCNPVTSRDMSELKRIDDHVARLKWRLSHSEMTYELAIAADELIAILTAMRSQLVCDMPATLGGTGRSAATGRQCDHEHSKQPRQNPGDLAGAACLWWPDLQAGR